MTNIAIRILLAVFAAYRTANIITREGGPFNCFAKLRGWLYTRYETARMLDTRIGLYPTRKFWLTASDLFTCPYCLGVWTAFLFAVFAYSHNWIADILLLGFGIAGGQALLTQINDTLKDSVNE